ncbi:MAG: TlpA family protein disulfide reductase [Armatimonadetes bacterium]|nr:TlpA family protein disulfide reductase [Armatimonadota bacterium]
MSDRAKTWLAALLALGALGLLLFSVRSVNVADEAGLTLRPAAQAEPASDFTLPDAATGRPVHLLAEARAHPVVLDFWATWCGPCREELPSLNRVAHKYAGRAAFYGVNSHDRPADIRAFARLYGMTFPTLSDARHDVASQYGADALPTLVIIDTRGNVRVASAGYDPQLDLEAALSRILDALLAGNPRHAARV